MTPKSKSQARVTAATAENQVKKKNTHEKKNKKKKTKKKKKERDFFPSQLLVTRTPTLLHHSLTPLPPRSDHDVILAALPVL
jgi:hypothetical protein